MKFEKIKYLVWDLDGTLTTSTKKTEDTFAKKMFIILAKKLGVSVSEAKKRFKKRLKKLKGSTKTLNSLGVDGFQIVAQIQEQIKWDKIIKKDEKLQKTLALLNNFTHILLTDNTEKSGMEKLKLLGIDCKLFKKMFFGISLQTVKPDKELFQMVLNYTKAPVEEHLMIGDKIEKDIKPAKKLGMRTCLIGNNSNVADLSIESVYSIVNYLNLD